jgi:hypothetical protein
MSVCHATLPNSALKVGIRNDLDRRKGVDCGSASEIFNGMVLIQSDSSFCSIFKPLQYKESGFECHLRYECLSEVLLFYESLWLQMIHHRRKPAICVNRDLRKLSQHRRPGSEIVCKVPNTMNKKNINNESFSRIKI